MKVYLASRYSQKEDTKVVARHLRKLGFKITSQWLKEPHAPNTTLDMCSGEDLSFYAVQDFDDIKRADVFVLFSVDPLIPTVRGGRHVETGIALALGKPVYIVGPKENIFAYLPGVQQFNYISDLIVALTKENRPCRS